MEGAARAIAGAIPDLAHKTDGRGGRVAAETGARRLRHELDPDTTGGAILLGLRAVAVVGHGNSEAEGIANAVRLAARCAELDAVGRTAALLRDAGVTRGSSPPPPKRDRKVTWTAKKSSTWSARISPRSSRLTPRRIVERTRFREDLEADSLDLYELVMELEDRYGIKVSEEQATRIKTVGEAVAFVLQKASA